MNEAFTIEWFFWFFFLIALVLNYKNLFGKDK